MATRNINIKRLSGEIIEVCFEAESLDYARFNSPFWVAMDKLETAANSDSTKGRYYVTCFFGNSTKTAYLAQPLIWVSLLNQNIIVKVSWNDDAKCYVIEDVEHIPGSYAYELKTKKLA